MNYRDRLLLAAVGASFAAFFLWSILFETILPLIESGDDAGLVRNIIGIPLLVGGTAGFVWGAWLLLRAIFVRQPSWRRVAAWLLSSIVCIGIGGFLTR